MAAARKGRNKPPPRGHGFSRADVGTRLVRALVAALALGAALSYLEPHVWLGALLSELRLHLALVAAVAFGLAVAQRDRYAAPGAFALGIALAASVTPLYRAHKPGPQAGPVLRVAHGHLNGAALTTQGALHFVLEQGAQVVALTGLRDADARELPRNLGGYRVQHRGGSALFVRANSEGVRFPGDLGELASVSLAVGRCQVRVVAIDLPSRFDYAALAARKQRLAELARVKRVVRSVWLGHLGSRPDASDLAPFLASGELRDSRRSYGLLATAPQALGALGVPVDHLLVHGWVGVRERGVAPGPTPSSHRAVTALLELTEPACRP